MEARGRSGLNGEMTTTAPLSAGSALILATGLGCALVAGVFFAFSSFVMKGLGELRAPEGVTAMQALNRAAPSPLFMTALFGTAALAIAAGVDAARHLDDPSARLVLAGGALYLAGVALTVGYHVPRNDALARLAPSDPAAAAEWARYLTTWTRANHVRTVTSVGAAVAYVTALSIES